MDKIAVIGDYDSIYGFQTLGLSICPVRDAEEGKEQAVGSDILFSQE